MKIIHHTDNDGFCAAAIVGTELANPFAPMLPEDYIPYNYGYTIDPNFAVNPGERVYIVDVSLSKPIHDLVIKILNDGGFVIHIDHHKSGIDYYDNIPETDVIKANGHYKHLFRNGVCGALLTWVYCHMTEPQKEECDNVEFDFEDNWNHFVIGTTEYSIPPALRYINDRDVWLKYFPETDAFTEGIRLEEDLSPRAPIWTQLLYNWSTRIISDYINRGSVVLQYLRSTYKHLIKRAHTSDILPCSMLCVNTSIKNSELFGNLLKPVNEEPDKRRYDVGCIYSYNGAIGLWEYSFYSDKNGPKVNELLEELFTRFPDGVVSYGGHEHAAGAVLEYQLFDEWIEE